MKQTTILDRTKAPITKPIESLRIPTPQKVWLDNKIPVHYFDMSTQQVVSISILIKAGQWHEPQKLVASFMGRMLREGTKNRTAQEIADTVAYHGAVLKTSSSSHFTHITLQTLPKHLNTLLPIIKDIVNEATFPETELQHLIQRSKEYLQINQDRTNVVAFRALKESLFGKNHPYGYQARLEDYEAITIDKLQKFYEQYCIANHCTIYLGGYVKNDTIQLINKYLGQKDWAIDKKIITPTHTIQPISTQKIYINKPTSVQTNIRIGQQLFTKTHPDYAGFFVLNTILGGYFGSRLSKQIRERKGYTYSIYSSLVPLLKSGYFYITTDVETTSWEKVIQEIFLEINRLKNDLITQEELQMVKSYLMGWLLTSMDGVFKMLSNLQGVAVYGLQLDFYHQLAHTIQYITPQELRQLAQKHLDTNKCLQVIVGA